RSLLHTLNTPQTRLQSNRVPEWSKCHEEPRAMATGLAALNMTHCDDATTVRAALLRLASNPYELLVAQWNWKSAGLSALFRGAIFFGVNLKVGISAATAALLAEFFFRFLTAGFYGAITQAFRKAEPAWKAALAVMFVFPLLQHVLSFLVHWYRGTPLLA